MSVTLIIGPMYSGKTSELIRLIDRKRHADKKCLIIKKEGDIRFDDSYVTTHSQIRYKNCDVIHLMDITDEFIDNLILSKKYDVVGIEEGQFFVDLSKYCNKLADGNIDIIISALDGTFKQELFKEIGILIPWAENVIKLNAICMMCKNSDGNYTIRTNDIKEEICIGGEEMYKSVCRPCLNNFKIQKDNCIEV
jgi:thymidine kinase